MLKPLLILCALIWIPIIIHRIAYQGFHVLLVWIFIAPVASNLINKPGINPFFKMGGEGGDWVQLVTGYEVKNNAYITGAATVTLYEMLEPTRLLLIAFLLIVLLDLLLKRKSLGHLNGTEVCMAVFSIILVVNVVLQSNRLFFGLRTITDAFVIPFLAYFFGRRLVTTEYHFRKLLQVMAYMGLYLIIVALVERSMHQQLSYRLGGPFRDANTLHVVISVVFFLVLACSYRESTSLEEKKALPDVVRWAVLLLAPVIILLTLGRGNWVAFLLAVWIFMFLGSRLISFSRKVRTLGLLLTLVPLLAVCVLVIKPEKLFGGRAKDIGTVYSRIATWIIIQQESGKAPIFGIGLNNLRTVLAVKRTQFNKAASVDSAHNSFISLLVEVGVIGLLAYLAIVTSIVRMGMSLYQTRLQTRDRWWGIAVIAVMITYQVPALFANTLYIPDPLQHVYVYMTVGGISGLYGRQLLAPALRTKIC